MIHKYTLFTCLVSILSICNVFATDYYIDSQNGNDQNNGLSVNNAFRSLYKIDNINLQPGDTVFFREGNYSRPGQTLLTINESGTEDNYITFTNYKDETPVLEFDSWTGIDIIGGSSYITIDGLHVKGARTKVNLESAINQGASCANDFSGNAEGFYNGTGILAVGPNLRWSNSATSTVPHHIEVINCKVYDCTSSGIAFQQADYVTVKNSEVYDNCWYTIYGTSGINLYQLVNTDGTNGFHNEITNNLIHGNRMLVPQVPFCEFLDGNGLIVDDLKHTQTENYKNQNNAFEGYNAKTLVANNIAVENGGSGLHFYLSDWCFIFNNTVANNAFQNDGENGNGELRIGSSFNFFVRNNIFKSDYTVHHVEFSPDFSNINYANNYQFGPDINEDLVNCPNCIEDVEIEFLNTDISSDTPYITSFEGILTNAGSQYTNGTNYDYLGNLRPYAGSYDIGAYELLDCALETWYADTDGDGYGDTSDIVSACDQPEGYVANSDDLCANDSLKNEPGECGCGIEEGTCEDECEVSDWFADFDGDGFGDINDIISACDQPEGYVADSSDLCTNDSLKNEPGKCGCGENEGTCEEEEPSGEICDSQDYDSNAVYSQSGTTVLYNGIAYQNNWYTQGQLPTSGGPWAMVALCDAAPSDCSLIQIWSASEAYSQAGTQVVYDQNIYENKWYIQGGVPGEEAAWSLVGFCDTVLSSGNNLSVENSSNNLIQVYSLAGELLMEYHENDKPDSLLETGIYIITTTNENTGAASVEKISF